MYTTDGGGGADHVTWNLMRSGSTFAPDDNRSHGQAT